MHSQGTGHQVMDGVLSLYTAISPLGHSRQVYIVLSGLQDERQQGAVSN